MMLASLQSAAQPAACLRAGSALLQHYLALDLIQVCTCCISFMLWPFTEAWGISTLCIPPDHAL